MKLRIKIMIILVITVVVAMSGSGLFFIQQYKTAFRDSVYQTVNSAAEYNAVSLKNYLFRQHSVAEHIGRLLPIFAVEHKDYHWIEKYLAKYSADFSFFENGFFFLDSEGILRADYPPHPELHGRDYSFRSYFQRTMAEKKGVIGQPYRSSRTGKGVLTFTTYVSATDGTPLGLVGCSTRLEDDNILSKIRDRKVGKTGYSYVYDKSRLMILHPKSERMLTRDVPVGVNEKFDAAIEGYEGTSEIVNSKGVEMLTAFRQVPGIDWIVGSQLPAKEAYAPLWASQKIFALFILCGSIFAAMGGLFFVHRSMRDLTTLEAVTAKLTIPDKANHDIEDTLTAETEKLEPLIDHPEFGPLASTIADVYKRLGRSLVESQLMTRELDEAYQQLKTTQLQILQNEKMASVGQLAAGVAHEINNPMGFITSNLSTLKRYQDKLTAYINQLEDWLRDTDSGGMSAQLKELKKKQKIDYIVEDIDDLIAESADGAERVKTIVQNLKSFSRVDQSEFNMVDINECLESTIAIAWNEIKYKATLNKSFGDIPLVPCFPQQLNQVFLNILVNAAQAIEGMGEISIKTWADEQRLNIAISDNGPGIPEQVRDKIFEPFFTTKDVGKGTGLGMSISYEIIKKHQGQIRLDSEEGQGTTFTIELPLSREEEA